MPRGGRRSGTPGTSYPNRSDLASPRLPAQAAPGQPYGVAGAQVAAQQAVPIQRPQAVPTAPSAAAAPPVLPGSFGPLDRPTERPGEPVTAGAPVGAGPGPEVLGLGPPPPQQLGQLLNQLAASNPDVAVLAAWANGGSR